MLLDKATIQWLKKSDAVTFLQRQDNKSYIIIKSTSAITLTNTDFLFGEATIDREGIDLVSFYITCYNHSNEPLKSIIDILKPDDILSLQTVLLYSNFVEVRLVIKRTINKNNMVQKSTAVKTFILGSCKVQ